jgi:hypothetical protein
MAMGKRSEEQETLFITHQQLRSQSHPYYRAVNRILAEKGFDRYAEAACARFYAKKMGPTRDGPRRVLPVPAVGLLRGHRQ